MLKKTLAPSTEVITVRDPKGLKFISIVEAAYNKAGLSEKEAQRVNDTSGLADIIGNFIADNRLTDKYKEEEVSSRYGYFSGYKKPKDVSWQSNRLRELFPGVGFHDEKVASADVLDGAEGYFAIPRWQTIVKHLPVERQTYGEAVQIVLDELKKVRKGKFYNYREGQLGPDQLRQSAKAAAAWEQIGQEQKDFDILLIPAQFGIRHRGRSVRRAREVMESNEFGLGAFAIGIMLLLHADRLKHYNDLWIDCAGDEFSPGAGGRFGHAPCFDFVGAQVRFDALGVGSAGGRFGSASGFLPQKIEN